MTFKQAPREPDDGPVEIRRDTFNGRERIYIRCGEDAIVCSPFNASRIFVMLALFLEISISKAVSKAIKM